MRIRPKKRIARKKPDPLTRPVEITHVWSMDFMYDQPQDGRSCRLFKVVGEFNREELGIGVDFSLPSGRVIRSLGQVIEWRGKSDGIRCGNGPEHISNALGMWAEKQGIRLEHTQPGEPRQNACVERYDRTVRYDGLNQQPFEGNRGGQD